MFAVRFLISKISFLFVFLIIGCQLENSGEITAGLPVQTTGSGIIGARCDLQDPRTTRCRVVQSDQNGSDHPIGSESGYQFKWEDPKKISGQEPKRYDCYTENNGREQVCSFVLASDAPVTLEFRVYASNGYVELTAADQATLPVQMRTYGVAPQIRGNYIPIGKDPSGKTRVGFQPQRLDPTRYNFGRLKGACSNKNGHFFASDFYVFRIRNGKAEVYAGAPYTTGLHRLQQSFLFHDDPIYCEENSILIAGRSQDRLSYDNETKIFRVAESGHVQELLTLQTPFKSGENRTQSMIFVAGLGVYNGTLWILQHLTELQVTNRYVTSSILLKFDLKSKRVSEVARFLHRKLGSLRVGANGQLYAIDSPGHIAPRSRKTGSHHFARVVKLNLKSNQLDEIAPGRAFMLLSDGGQLIIERTSPYRIQKHHNGSIEVVHTLGVIGKETFGLHRGPQGDPHFFGLFQMWNAAQLKAVVNSNVTKLYSQDGKFQLPGARALTRNNDDVFFVSSINTVKSSLSRLRAAGSDKAQFTRMLNGKKGSPTSGALLSTVSLGLIHSLKMAPGANSELYVAASQDYRFTKNRIYRVSDPSKGKKSRVYVVAETEKAIKHLAFSSGGDLFYASDNEVFDEQGNLRWTCAKDILCTITALGYVKNRLLVGIKTHRPFTLKSGHTLKGGRYLLGFEPGSDRTSLDYKFSCRRRDGKNGRSEVIQLETDSLGRVYSLERFLPGGFDKLRISEQLKIITGLGEAGMGCTGVREETWIPYVQDKDLRKVARKDGTFCNAGYVDSALDKVQGTAASFSRLCRGSFTGFALKDSCSGERKEVALTLGMLIGSRKSTGFTSGQLVHLKVPCVVSE